MIKIRPIRENKAYEIYRKACHLDVARKLSREIEEGDSVLDFGCGWDSPLQYCRTGYSLGVDAYGYYLELSKRKAIHSEYLEEDINNLEFESGSFNVVLCAQVLEHLTKEGGLRILEKMERWAANKVIITTPNGFLIKGTYDENELQDHLSGWTTSEFKMLGYKVRGSSGLKIIRIKCNPSIFWRVVFNTSSTFTSFIPKYAFQLFAVKEVHY